MTTGCGASVDGIETPCMWCGPRASQRHRGPQTPERVPATPPRGRIASTSSRSSSSDADVVDDGDAVYEEMVEEGRGISPLAVMGILFPFLFAAAVLVFVNLGGEEDHVDHGHGYSNSAAKYGGESLALPCLSVVVVPPSEVAWGL